MSHLCCPSCRLRFSRAAAAFPNCPVCDRRLVTLPGGASLVGCALFDPADSPQTLPEAIAVAIPVIDLDGDR